MRERATPQLNCSQEKRLTDSELNQFDSSIGPTSFPVLVELVGFNGRSEGP